jgi:type I restriction enzyme S subunit
MKRLGDLVRYRKGKPPRAGEHGRLPVLSPHYLRTGEIEEMAEPTPRDVLLNGGELILLWDGSNAGEFFRARAGVLSSTMVVFDFDPESTNPDYLYFDLKRFEPELKGRTSGSGIPHVDKEILLAREICERSPDEQRVAADVLLKIELAIEQTETLLAKQQRVKAGLMQDLLTYGLDAQGCLRDPSTFNFKPSIFGPIPVAWHVSGLESKKGSTRAFIRTGPFGTAIKQSDWRETGIPVITIGCIVDGKANKVGLQFLSEEKAKELAVYGVQEGDILFSRVADVGRAIVVGKNESGWLMSSNLMRISLDATKALPAFVHLMLTHHRTSRQTRQSVNSSGRDVANTAILSSLKFTWPPIDEQAAIVKAHMTNVRASERLDDELGKLQRIKAGLMQDLLTGRVPVTPLLPNPPQ